MKECPKQHSENKSRITRRGFLKGLGATAAAGAAGYGAYKYLSNTESEKNEPIYIPEKFETFLESYRTWWAQPRNYITFKDSNGAIVGKPIELEDFEVEWSDVGRTGEGKYLLSPGPKDAHGNYGIDNIPPEWVNYVKEHNKFLSDYDPNDLTIIHATNDFKAALSETDEPNLIAGIQNGSINTVMDIVHYFGDKPVRGADNYSRINYVKKMVTFNHPHMSETVKAELRELLPAICAKESKFNDDLTSKSGARGISQFMPSTWAGLGYGEYGRFEPLTKQVEAMGKHCDNIYSEIRSNGVEEALEDFVMPLFSDKASYEQNFLVPCMINAYNPGAGRLRVAIMDFLEQYPADTLRNRYVSDPGKDLFYDLVKFAEHSNEGALEQYGKHSAEYSFYVYSASPLLQKRHDERMVSAK